MTDAPKHDISDKSDSRSAKRKKGFEKYQNYKTQSYPQWKGTKAVLQSGDSGVFVTCDRGREAKATAEAVDLFSQTEKYIEPSQLEETDANDDNDDNDDEGDIEAQIKKEIEGMKPAKRANNAPFQIIKMDVQCVSFIKLNKNIDPSSLVHRICVDAEANPEQARCRWIRRLTPVTQTRKVLGGGLEELAALVLKPYFHSDGPPKKYAIRPTIRQNGDWNRDTVINMVAAAVGPRHTVDLKNYDYVILVDVIRKICGMSVAGSDYDRLKRYNPAEIYNPTPKPVQKDALKENKEDTPVKEGKEDTPPEK
ncbi:hypothetical protein FQN54_007223 [Arachnomyces sp. PD_36]|nr:hypothetical protein FQN54_007223 [Arachnomyces sp. PD_36]